MIYRTKGVCSSLIHLDVENDMIKSVEFIGGCNGNLQGISKLVEGMTVQDAILKLSGIRCNGRTTSCPDQLANALMALSSN